MFTSFVCFSVPETISFDTLFYPTIYKKVLDESMNLCGELDALYETDDEVNIDSLTGRIVRYLGLLNDLILHQEKTNAYLSEDVTYLLIILDHLQQRYQNNTHAKLYSALTPLFELAQQKLFHLFGLL
jgi:hypothetical protein